MSGEAGGGYYYPDSEDEERRLPPGIRYPTQEELDQLAREPDPYCTAGPYVGGWLQIGYRTLLLTEEEAAAMWAAEHPDGVER